MIGFTAKVTYAAGPKEGEVFEPRVTPRVLINFERKWEKSVVAMFGDEMKFEPLMWLAWDAMKCAMIVVEPFDEWVTLNEPGVELVSPPAPLDAMAPPVSLPQ